MEGFIQIYNCFSDWLLYIYWRRQKATNVGYNFASRNTEDTLSIKFYFFLIFGVRCKVMPNLADLILSCISYVCVFLNYFCYYFHEFCFYFHHFVFRFITFVFIFVSIFITFVFTFITFIFIFINLKKIPHCYSNSSIQKADFFIL